MAKRERVVPLSRDERAVIRALRPAMAAMMRAFEAELVRDEGMTHTEYVALMFLSEAADRTLRLSDLAARCQQSLSAISRTVGRLEGQGLVRREQSVDDARAYNAVLTDAGLARLERAWPTHIDSVRRHLFDHLDGVDLRALARSLERIAGSDSSADSRQPSTSVR